MYDGSRGTYRSYSWSRSNSSGKNLVRERPSILRGILYFYHTNLSHAWTHQRLYGFSNFPINYASMFLRKLGPLRFGLPKDFLLCLVGIYSLSLQQPPPFNQFFLPLIILHMPPLNVTKTLPLFHSFFLLFLKPTFFYLRQFLQHGIFFRFWTRTIFCSFTASRRRNYS